MLGGEIRSKLHVLVPREATLPCPQRGSVAAANSRWETLIDTRYQEEEEVFCRMLPARVGCVWGLSKRSRNWADYPGTNVD
jgi:hypothetical protein